MASINSEIEYINEAKTNLADALITKFGVRQYSTTGNPGLWTGASSSSPGTLKRLADWATLVNATVVPTHWSSLALQTSPQYNTAPEFGKITIGAGTASAAASSGSRCRLEYDNVNKCLKFIFD